MDRERRERRENNIMDVWRDMMAGVGVRATVPTDLFYWMWVLVVLT